MLWAASFVTGVVVCIAGALFEWSRRAVHKTAGIGDQPPLRLPGLSSLLVGSGDWQQRVLIVTAHPDDECMFFSPSVALLTRRNADIFILCLSTGQCTEPTSIPDSNLGTICGDGIDRDARHTSQP